MNHGTFLKTMFNEGYSHYSLFIIIYLFFDPFKIIHDSLTEVMGAAVMSDLMFDKERLRDD